MNRGKKRRKIRWRSKRASHGRAPCGGGHKK